MRAPTVDTDDADETARRSGAEGGRLGRDAEGAWMADDPAFELWLEFEHWEPKPDDDPTDDFFNMQVKLPDGRRYALNVWTFKFIQKARYPWPYEEGVGEPEEYLLPPDLFVERLDR